MNDKRHAPHLVGGCEGFSWWRTFCLRGAGFPVDHVVGLADPEQARAADAASEAIAAAALAWSNAVGDCERLLPDAAGDERYELEHCLRSLKARRPLRRDHPSSLPPSVSRWTEAERVATEAAAKLEAEFTLLSPSPRSALAAFASDPKVREAMTWQNPSFIATAVDRFLEHDGANDKKARQRALAIASYLQRYCAKNDSVGFFGPIGWGEWGDSPGVHFSPGETVASPTIAHFEEWAAQAVADALFALPGAPAWCRPRRSPLIRVDAELVYGPFGAFEIPQSLHAVLRAVDGLRTARDIYSDLERGGQPRNESEQALLTLAEQGLVRWKIEIPTYTVHALDVLRRWVETVEDEAVAATARHLIDQVEEGRRRCEVAVGADALLEALKALDETFTRVTGVGASRNPGSMYAARTVVRAMAHRNTELVLGTDVRAALERPLGLLATAARWWSSEIGAAAERSLTTLTDKLLAENGDQDLSLMTVWPQIAAMFPRSHGTWDPECAAVTDTYFEKWTELIGFKSGMRRIDVRSEDLAGPLHAAFPSNAPGWPGARGHSPDVMISARSVAELQRGECTYVLGEAHLYCNTIEQGIFAREFPDPDALRSALRADHPHGRLVPAAFECGVGSTFADHPDDVIVESDWLLPWQERSHVVPASELVLERRGGEFYAATRDGRRRWSIRSALDGILSDFRGLTVVPDAPHTPRVTIDRLVVARETWRFDAADLDFARADTPAARFRSARRFAHDHEMPRLCFFKCDNETKPCFVDFEAPLFVEIFAKQVRAAKNVSISEMLPLPDESWLTDAAGRHYASEIRMVLIDEQDFPRRSSEK